MEFCTSLMLMLYSIGVNVKVKDIGGRLTPLHEQAADNHINNYNDDSMLV